MIKTFDQISREKLWKSRMVLLCNYKQQIFSA